MILRPRFGDIIGVIAEDSRNRTLFGLLPISWSSDNGSHLFVDSVDEASGGSSSIGTYLSQVAENSAGVRYPRELCGRSVLYSPLQAAQRSGLRFALELLAVQEFVANLAME